MLPDLPLLAGTPSKFALIQRISATASGTFACAVGNNAVGTGTFITIPLSVGQGIQVRDLWCNVDDNANSGFLAILSLMIFINGPGAGQGISQRGFSPAYNSQQAGQVNLAGGTSIAFGTTDWPFIAYNDFPQFGSSLAPNLRVVVQALIKNYDVAAHSIDINAGCIWEVWQSQPIAPPLGTLGHVGFQ
jgi:hypothetical protein